MNSSSGTQIRSFDSVSACSSAAATVAFFFDASGAAAGAAAAAAAVLEGTVTRVTTRPAAAEIRLSTGDGRSGGGGDTGVLAHASSGAAARLKLGQLVRVRLRNVDKGGRVEVEVIG